MSDFFVYLNERRHMWRFVHYARRCRDAHEAIAHARAEAEAMGNSSHFGYMAVPADAVTTADFTEPVDSRDL